MEPLLDKSSILVWPVSIQINFKLIKSIYFCIKSISFWSIKKTLPYACVFIWMFSISLQFPMNSGNLKLCFESEFYFKTETF